MAFSDVTSLLAKPAGFGYIPTCVFPVDSRSRNHRGGSISSDGPAGSREFHEQIGRRLPPHLEQNQPCTEPFGKENWHPGVQECHLGSQKAPQTVDVSRAGFSDWLSLRRQDASMDACRIGNRNAKFPDGKGLIINGGDAWIQRRQRDLIRTDYAPLMFSQIRESVPPHLRGGYRNESIHRGRTRRF